MVLYLLTGTGCGGIDPKLYLKPTPTPKNELRVLHQRFEDPIGRDVYACVIDIGRDGAYGIFVAQLCELDGEEYCFSLYLPGNDVLTYCDDEFKEKVKEKHENPVFIEPVKESNEVQV